ncbi:MAG: FadR/GntR family transcriptional regulator [Mycobacteriaceae bacterium]
MSSSGALPVGPVADTLRLVRRIIDERALGAGDRLPTERELATRAGVSRTTIRAALDELEEQGIILRHVGRGTYLTPQPVRQPNGRFDDCSPAEIMASRIVLEPQLMPLAVTCATGEDITEMRRCLQAGDAARDSTSFERCDTELHHAFALATHNSVLIMVSQLLIDARQQPVWGSLKERGHNPDRHHAYCAQHHAIVDAVIERDAIRAAQAMRDHLDHVRVNLLG